MTKRTPKSPMELDLDALLQSHATTSDTDSDDDGPNSIHRRTVDEILNDSSTSSSSSSSPSSSPVRRLPPLLSPKPIPPAKIQISETPLPVPPIPTVDESIRSLHSNDVASDLKTNASAAGSVVKPTEFSISPFTLGRSYSRPLPPLFGGVKPNPKPGAALAAAAAASRSIPTPHAAAIKFRRASSSDMLLKPVDRQESVGVDDSEGFERLGLTPDDVSIPAGSETTQSDDKLVKEDDRVENLESLMIESNLAESAEILHESDESQAIQENQAGQTEVLQVDEEEFVESDHSLDNEIHMVSDSNDTVSENSGTVENSTIFNSTTVVEERIPSAPQNQEASLLEEDSTFSRSDRHDLDANMSSDHRDGEDTNSRSDVTECFDDISIQLESKRLSKKSGKKLRSSLKPLELAEELEKKLASSGLHWEEGAAAQPMRLEGIRRGPPAVGYLQIDPDNAITRMISSQAFRRDHGSAQVVSVHMNFIAVGMSKGTVLIVPSKYSPHHADNMDTKIMMLGSPGEKSHSPVTSMCFNQQGDLLLVGYGDGHLTVWDVQRGTTIKTITGEHTAPVVYILFLGQDSQVTRQIKAVTGDCKGLVLLHTFSVVPLLNRFSIKTQCLLDGQKGGVVLSASALLIDDLHGAGLTSAHGSATASSSGIGSMVGGVVGVVGGDAGWKLFSEGSSLVEEGVVIFVTNQTALVVRLTPSFQVYTQLVKPDGVREGSMPYTAWKCYSRGSSTEQMPMEASEKASLLAIAWDRKVQVAKLIKSELKVYKEWTLDSAAIGVAWLDDRMLVVLTVRGQLLLFAKEGTELHRTSFFADGSGGDDIITYHAHFINNFGNPEKAYHNSVAVRGATIYILGPTHLLTSRLLPWKERIQVLQKAGDWMGALDMAMRLYDGHAHGVIDLPRTVDAIQEAIMPYLVELLLSYVDEVFSYISVAFCNQVGKVEQSDESKSSTSLHSQIQEQYARVGGVAVEFCVHIKRTDILFDDIFSKFVAVQQGGTFLELLEPYILKDMLGCLPPEIMQALVEHYSSKGWLQRVEQCVLHMDISSLDFNQVVRLCREHGLYGALIYLFNRGLDDFKAPLEELLVVVQKNLKTNATTVGYRMLVYLKYCFLGHAFPPGHGAIPSPRLPALRTELLQFLLEDSSFKDSQVAAKFKSSAGVCPNLCYLLWLDTKATLEVLRYAFPDEEPLVTESYVNDLDNASIKVEKRLDFSNSESQNLMVQNTVSTLINILEIGISEVDRSYGMDDNGSVEVWPSKKDIGHLLQFIACCVSCKGATVSKRVLNHILEFLTSDIDPSSNILSHKTQTGQKREKQVLALLKVVPETDWDSSYLLNLCEKAQFYQVCAFIYRTRGLYLAALDSYMKDEDEPVHAFVFINSLLLQLKESELSGFQLAVISKISELVSLNREGTLFLVMDHFSQESNRILSELQARPKSLFLFLKTVIEVHLSGTLDFSSLQRAHVLDLPCGRKIKDQSRELETYLERISNFPKLLRQNSIQVTDEMAELYLELLCQYDRHSVLKFLETFENYRVEHCLRLCQEYAVTDAAAFLLERVGDVGNALLLIISDLDEKLQMIDTALETKVPEIISGVFTKKEHLNEILRMKEVHLIRDVLHASIGLCQRNTPRLDQEESESLWFRLLDSFCVPLRDLYNDKKISTGTNHVRSLVATVSRQEDKEASIFKWRISRFDKGVHILQRVFSQFIREIVEGMVGYVSLPTIMAKLLSDNGGQEFGDFKLTILGMLGTYRYERRILDTAKSLIEDDTYYTMSLLKKGASHAYAPQSFTCCICSCSLAKDCSASSIRVFNCGHVTHVLCEFQENEVLNRDNSAGCPICMPKKKTSRARSKSVLVENGLVKNSLWKPQQAQGITTPQYIHESDAIEKSYGLQQMSRFELLSNLGKTDKPLQIDTLPALRLAPPAIYHEKVKKGSDLLTGESSNIPLKGEKPSKIRQVQEQKMKGSSIRFPLKSSIFGSENRR